MAEWPDSDTLCRQMAEETGGICFPSFSRGKDSIAAWLQLRRYFDRIIPSQPGGCTSSASFGSEA